MFHAGKGSKLFLEFADLRTHDPLSAFDRSLNGPIERLAKPAALSLQIDEWDCGCHLRLRVRKSCTCRRLITRRATHVMLRFASRYFAHF
jgi:hypothetical protein